MNILDMEEFKDFEIWDSNTSKMLQGKPHCSRNFEIFKHYLGSFQGVNCYNSVSLGKKYNLTRSRVLDIFYKYNIHFIAYLVYIKNYSSGDSLIIYLISLLSKSGKISIQKHLIDGKPTKYLTSGCIKFMQNYNN